MTLKRLKVKQQQRKASYKPTSYNEETRTMEVVFSTGARVLRRSWSGDYLEELDMSKSSVRLGRFKKGAPVLDSHDRWSLKSQIGVVESARIENGQGIAKIRFSEREEVQPIIQDIIGGVIRNVSVGYQTHKIKEDKEADGVRLFRAVDWEPTELSFVTVPADADAQARSADDTMENECEFEYLERSAEENESPTPLGHETSAPVEDARSEDENQVNNPKTDELPANNRAEESSMTPEEMKKLREEAAKAERLRASSIREAVRKAGLADEIATRMVDDGTEIDAARALIIDALAERDEKTSTASTNVQVGADNSRENTRSGITDAILHRYDRKKFELNDNSKRFAHLSLAGMAGESLRAAGVDTQSMDNRTVIQMALRGAGYHSTSDFPIILENIITKTMQRGYEEAPRTWAPLVREMTVNDFKQVSRVHLGEFSQLEEVLEGGEYKHGSVSERGEKYAISKFGKMIAVTWEMLINDDMSAFTSIPQKLGKKARDLESDKVWAVLTANTQLMAEDGLAIFHANHNNLNAGGAGAVSETTLAAIREKMRLHKDLGGTSPLNLFPAHIFVPASREVETMKILRTITPNQSSQVNLFGQDSGFSLSPQVEPRLDAVVNKPWFVSADVNSVDIMEVARLAGEESPSVQSRDGFDVDGVEFKIRHLFVAHAIDYRGLQRNNGA